ncbi:hypothetical protein TVAG_157560 [Trichomonas vaginalis G3]|uniref:Uncharacterized protein n=1 Tax=Trichomonas vaginalis (strain ATCC PRA-98 / G3) TaxID=412133 RepID=A2E9M8_TRIV3|nr:hypothetical protein TVAGG3_0746140 [Trichomonas vaginalis G3]EAY10679.1 hypothetical protein TVAG_157560 [Trichomonas vaginalis G3]KAI5512179.1 hypothetical protein TVAGG3_0746140 [Trichomonas vaginalis G3]|eukprot:XP_001322902.1 hypothetical protein [Trichomonas vaginalis G3]
MRTASDRRRHLINAIKDLISPEEICKYPEAVIATRNQNILPLDELINLKPILQLNPTYDDVYSVCSDDSEISHMFSQYQRPSLKLNLKLSQTDLIVSGFPNKTKLEGFRPFVSKITGNNNFKLSKKDDDFLISFTSLEDTISFWRSLAYLRFEGCHLTARANVTQIKSSRGKQRRSSGTYERRSNLEQNRPKPKILIERSNNKCSLNIERNTQKTLNISI